MKTFNIQELVNNPIEFEKQKNELKDLILNDFKLRHDECAIIINNEKIVVTQGQMLLNLFLLSLFKGHGLTLSKDDLFLNNSISGDDIELYLNKVLERIKDGGIDFNEYRQSVYEFLNETNDISGKTNILAGNTISLLDFINAEIEDPETSELFSAPQLDNLQFSEIEDIFNQRGKDIIKYFNSHKERNLSPFTRSKTGINAKQLTQSIGFGGLKPDFNGLVIPHVIKGNFLHGHNNIEDYFIIAKGARLALSTNYRMVRVSGYLTRKLALLMLDTWHDNSIDDCGTKHFVRYNIDSKMKLGMINGRHYYSFNDDGSVNYNNLHTIKNDESLIGKEIALRSPVTCLGNHTGGHICRTCYGKALSEINKNFNTGLVAVLLLTNILTQRLLSAKHCATCC